VESFALGKDRGAIMGRKRYDIVELVNESSQELIEQKYLEKLCQNLAENEQFFKEILDAAPCLLCCLDCNGNFLYMNQRYADCRGVHNENMLGHHFSEVMLPIFYEKRAKIFAQCLQGKTIKIQNQDRVKNKKNDSWFHGAYMPIFSKDGKVEKVLVAMMDVTEQEEMQHQINEAEKEATLRLREFSRAMPGAGMIVDALGIVVEVFDDNQLLSDEPVTWEGRKLSELLPREVAELLRKEISSAIAKNTIRFGEYTLNLLRGERIFDVRIAPLSYCLGGRPTVACYWGDVTEKKHTKKLLKSNYEKRRQRDLLNELAEGKIKPSQEILDQAWQVKLNLTHDFSCYLIGFKKMTENKIVILNERPDKLQAKIDFLVEQLTYEEGAIVWESKEGIAMLVLVEMDEIVTREQELLKAGKLQALLCRYAPELEYYIGIAEFHTRTFWQFAKVYAEARMAFEFGQKIVSKQVIYHYLDIGVIQFFPGVMEQGYVKDFVKRKLGKLEEYDYLNGTELVYTLEKILQLDNLNMVAKKLYVHRQTILFRKRRIETLLEVSLNDFETKLALGMALKFRQVFGKED